MRPLITKPQSVKYKILTYPEATTQLQADLKGHIDSKSIGTGNFHAVALEFSLPSGSYATIALREITRLLVFVFENLNVFKCSYSLVGNSANISIRSIFSSGDINCHITWHDII